MSKEKLSILCTHITAWLVIIGLVVALCLGYDSVLIQAFCGISAAVFVGSGYAALRSKGK